MSPPRLARRRTLAAVAALPRAGCVAPAEGPAAALARRPARGDLLLDDAALTRLRVNAQADPAVAASLATLRRRAAELAPRPLVAREFEPGRPVMLPASRAALERIALSALLARLDGDSRHAIRARAELDAVAAFPDWNPSHFLDVAEMATAVALGTAWLGPALPAPQRARLLATLESHALLPAAAAYRAPGGWPAATHNWNLVCNGGITVAALVAGGHGSTVAGAVLDRAIASSRLAFAGYAPDGGWIEGPGYWAYATRYATLQCWALEQALGGSFGLAETAGFARTADFLRQMTGPSGAVFNWGDGSERKQPAGVAWLGARFGRPQDLALALEGSGIDLVLALVAGARNAAPAHPGDLPLGARFAAADVVSLRGAWGDPGATWLALKGGRNDANHADLDLGSFVLEAAGERWAIELGADDYALPGYFGRDRWRWYRKGTAGQNTLVLGGDQALSAHAPVVAFRDGDERRFAVVDLSAAWGHPPGRILRGAVMNENNGVLLQDDLPADERREALWQIHTRAEIVVDGGVAQLTQGGRTLTVVAAAPSDARFEVETAARAAPEARNDGVRRLVLRVRESPRPAPRRIAVAFEPGAALPPEMSIEPLSHWVEIGGV